MANTQGHSVCYFLPYTTLWVQGVFHLRFPSSPNFLSKYVYYRNRTSDENFQLKIFTCDQSMALGTRTIFDLGTLIINVIFGIVYFRDLILGSSWKFSEICPYVF